VNDAAAKCMVNTIMLLYVSCSAHYHYFLFNYPHGSFEKFITMDSFTYMGGGLACHKNFNLKSVIY